jgi:hypothetical protein
MALPQECRLPQNLGGCLTSARGCNKRKTKKTDAIGLAHLAGVPVDELLSGRYAAGACPHCGYVRDFEDESTSCDGTRLPEPNGLLKLVR